MRVPIGDVAIYRANRCEMALVEEANQRLESKVRQGTGELEDANEQLVDAPGQLVRTEKLAGGVAHDMPNPLCPIDNAVYWLKGKLNGDKAFDEIRRIDPLARVIFIGGYELEYPVGAALRFGAYAAVTKPQNPDEMLALMRSVTSDKARL